MCTHITMDLQCTNIHSDVYTYHWIYNVQIYTVMCTHISMICTHHCACLYIVHPLWYVYTALCILVYCKSIVICVHIIVYICTLYIHITLDLQCTNMHNAVYTYHNECTNIYNDVHTYHWCVYTSLCMFVYCKSIVICVHIIVYIYTL
jgi:hypothetical protein